MPARKAAQPVTLNVSAPLPEIAPLGTQARADVAREVFPGISDTDAAVVALSSQVVQLEGQLAQANARIDALKETMTKLVAYVMTSKPVVAKVEEPVTPTPEPVVKAKPAKVVPAKAQAVVAPSPQAVAKVAATPPPPVAHALNVGPKVVATFDSFIAKGLDFSPLKVEGIDAKLAQPSATYLRDAANAYLAQYTGTSAYVQKIAGLKPEQRTVPQLRGVINSIFSLYVRAQKPAR